MAGTKVHGSVAERLSRAKPRGPIRLHEWLVDTPLEPKSKDGVGEFKVPFKLLLDKVFIDETLIGRTQKNTKISIL